MASALNLPSMDLVDPLRKAIAKIKEPRLFDSERGYQGQLKSEMDRLLEVSNPDFSHPLVEEEYQKRAEAHGVTLRPDIIVHIPFDRGVSPERTDDNFLVIQLKLAANEDKAFENFQALETICSRLKYPVGLSINIQSDRLFLQNYKPNSPGPFTLIEMSVQLVKGVPVMSEFTRFVP